MRIWDAATANAIAALTFRVPHWPALVDLSPDGSRVVTGCDNNAARIWILSKTITEPVWDRSTFKAKYLYGHEQYISSVAFSPDGSRIATASGDGSARIWNAVTGQEIAVLRGHTGSVGSAVFSPDGSRLVTASSDETARVWDLGTAKEIAVLHGHADEVYTAMFSPEGAHILTVSRDSVRIWDAATEEIAVLRGHAGSVYRANFNHDGC